jgi:AraC-like DNA-binding protein
MRETLPRTIPLAPIVAREPRPLAGALVQDQFDLDAPWHYHDMHQIQYAFEGALEVEDAKRRSLLPSQLAAWIPAGVAHRTSLHRVRSGSIMLAPQLVPNAGDRVRIIQVSPLMRAMVIGAMRWQITRLLDAKGEAYFTALAGLCDEWIEAEAPFSLPTSVEPRLLAAMTHTRTRIATATIGSASAAAGISERSLRRRFQALGMSWEEYRRRARLLAALELLSTTAEAIGEVADRVGYQNQSAFAKMFKALAGESPMDYRRRCESTQREELTPRTVRSKLVLTASRVPPARLRSATCPAGRR